jgi:hypothetical protein
MRKSTSTFGIEDLLEHAGHAQMNLDRRNFLLRTAGGLGAIALQSLWNPMNANTAVHPSMLKSIIPKAKRIVYLFMAGGPSQLESFDYKPKLQTMMGKDLPDSVRKDQRLTGMSANQASLPIAPSLYKFSKAGKTQTWVSELMPYTAQVVDELCIIKSIYTEAINHDPAITFFSNRKSTSRKTFDRIMDKLWIGFSQ